MSLNPNTTGELLSPEEKAPLDLVRKHLDSNTPDVGFSEIKQVAEHSGWDVRVIPNDRRDHNVAKFIASEKVIKIYPEGHSQSRLLWELAHEVTFGNLSVKFKQQPEFLRVNQAKQAIVEVTSLETELAAYTNDPELSEALGDKRIFEERLKNDSFLTKSAHILIDHQ